MTKRIYHPNAYLHKKRNVHLGLIARSKILNSLETHEAVVASGIGREASLHYNVVIHHLRLLEKEGVISSGEGRPIKWKLTGSGQKRLTSAN